MNKTHRILSTSYFPPVGYLYEIYKDPLSLIEAHENYQKKSIRNKCTLVTSNGIKTLSVPLLKGKHGSVPIQEVKIAYHEDWQSNHISTLQSAYANAPYYRFYHEEIFRLIRKNETHLYDLNHNILEWIRSTFMNEKVTRINTTESYRAVSILTFNTTRPYRQVYEKELGFVDENVSMIDLIFNVGYEIPLYFDNWVNFEV